MSSTTISSDSNGPSSPGPSQAALEALMETQPQMEDALRPAARDALSLVLRRATALTSDDMLELTLVTSRPYRAERYACVREAKPISKCLRPVPTADEPA